MGIVKGRHSLILLSCRYGPSSSFLPRKFSTALKPSQPVKIPRKGCQHTHNSRYTASNTLLPDIPLTSRKMVVHKATSTASASSTTPNPLRQCRRGRESSVQLQRTHCAQGVKTLMKLTASSTLLPNQRDPNGRTTAPYAARFDPTSTEISSNSTETNCNQDQQDHLEYRRAA